VFAQTLAAGGGFGITASVAGKGVTGLPSSTSQTAQGSRPVDKGDINFKESIVWRYAAYRQKPGDGRSHRFSISGT